MQIVNDKLETRSDYHLLLKYMETSIHKIARELEVSEPAVRNTLAGLPSKRISSYLEKKLGYPIEVIRKAYNNKNE